MHKPTPSCQPREARVHNLREVSLGFGKKIAQEEARRCPQCAQATCLPGCPLGIDIPGFIRFLREGDVALALERIKKDNPFPEICGRICPAPCERACIFYTDGAPIAIRGLERFAGDAGPSKSEKQILPLSGAKKVAIIGMGPAGMSAAYYLARANFSVTVFEAAHEPGGLLRYAVPEFRLPQKILDLLAARLRFLGIAIQTDAVFGATLMINELFMRGYSALLLATGASLPRFSDLPGSNLGAVYYDVEFLSGLQNINKQEALQLAKGEMTLPKNTVVLGGGYGAFDAARLSLRLGSQVDLVFAQSEEQLGVDEDMLKGSSEEGINIHFMQALEIIGDGNGLVRGVKCRKEEETVVLEAQRVIIAYDHRPGDLLKQYLPQLRSNEDGSWWVDAQTGMTNVEKVFACGNAAALNGSVAEAIAGGKAAAQKIIAYAGKL